MNEHLERLLKVNVEWLEENKSKSDLQEYASVATDTAQIAAKLGEQKETAVGAAVKSKPNIFKQAQERCEIACEIIGDFRSRGYTHRDAQLVLEEVKRQLEKTYIGESPEVNTKVKLKTRLDDLIRQKEELEADVEASTSDEIKFKLKRINSEISYLEGAIGHL